VKGHLLVIRKRTNTNDRPFPESTAFAARDGTVLPRAHPPSEIKRHQRDCSRNFNQLFIFQLGEVGFFLISSSVVQSTKCSLSAKEIVLARHWPSRDFHSFVNGSDFWDLMKKNVCRYTWADTIVCCSSAISLPVWLVQRSKFPRPVRLPSPCTWAETPVGRTVQQQNNRVSNFNFGRYF
jgi:hypothetical protein